MLKWASHDDREGPLQWNTKEVKHKLGRHLKALSFASYFPSRNETFV